MSDSLKRNGRRMWVLAIGVLGLAIAGTVSATDGVIEINQARALAGNVTPGDTPDFPVTISTGGSYRLTGNLTVASSGTNAISVTSDNVTIDLNGHTIGGPNSCSGCPATSCTATGAGNGIDGNVLNLVVRNGTIRGMGGAGIRGRGTFERLLLDQNGDRGVFATSGVTVKDSVVSSNGGIGITSGGGILSGNMVSCNGSRGIEIFAGSVIGNHTVQNGGDGIRVTAEAAVLSNNSNNNSGCGVNASRSQVSSNTIDNNQTCGIAVTTSGMVIGNTLDSNGPLSGSGKALNLAASVGFSDNQLRNHGTSCVAVSGGRETGHNVCDALVSCATADCPFFDPVCGPCIP